MMDMLPYLPILVSFHSIRLGLSRQGGALWPRISNPWPYSLPQADRHHSTLPRSHAQRPKHVEIAETRKRYGKMHLLPLSAREFQ